MPVLRCWLLHSGQWCWAFVPEDLPERWRSQKTSRQELWLLRLARWRWPYPWSESGCFPGRRLADRCWPSSKELRSGQASCWKLEQLRLMPLHQKREPRLCWQPGCWCRNQKSC